VKGGAALVRHPLAIAGVLIATASAVVFIALVIAMLAGLLQQNPYAGLVVFVAIPAVFVMGLLLVPLGVRLQRRRLARDPAAVDWPVLDFRRASVRRTALLVTALTAVNIVIILLAGYGSLHWMESPQFCGQVCHKPMHPQFTAWQNASHGRVACVACHIGEGPKAFVHAKLAGVRQLVHVAIDRVPQPIPPGAEMPAAVQAETCRGCHQAERAVGDRIRVIREYADDEKSTETETILQMHFGAASPAKRAIHWHASPDVRVEYIATDADRQTIPYVRVTNANGQVTEYRAPDTKDDVVNSGTRRTMDCIDCHNTVGHPIAPTPERAVDQAIAAALVSRDLPYTRREGVRLVKATYGDAAAALREIDQGLRTFYRSQGASADDQAVARTVAAVQDVYSHNVFPVMKVTFGTYPTNKGHITSNGCLRCHDGEHAAPDGKTINADCEYCHTQIERPGSQ
jgi:nitrate/TMAO reductase-like tetraheme cytochrome c subunit